MKKILIFSLAYYPNFVSGAEVAIKEITDRIDPTDIEFHLVTLLFDTTQPRKERIDNVYVHRVGFGGIYLSKVLFVPLAAFKALTLNKKYHFDALWAMMTYMLFPVVLSRLCGIKVPHILTLQDGDPYEKVFKRWFIRPLAPILDYGFKTVSVVQAISSYLAEWPAKRGYTGDVVLVPNGASLPSTQEYSQKELDEVRRSINVKKGERILLTVGRLAHQKAQDIVIRALPHLPSDIRYVMVGEGEDREMLKKLAQELGVADRIVFTGRVDRTMTAKYRKISDVFVLPSRSEGQGISFLSTMVSGLPVVATQEGGIADFLFDEKRDPDKEPTGWAVDKDSPEQIAEAVKDILANPEKVKRVTENAYKLVYEKYNWDVIAKDMQQKVFEQVMR